MKKLFALLFMLYFQASGQDKLFLKNGTTLHGDLISVGREYVYFKKSDTAYAARISRMAVLLADDDNGRRIVFAEDDSRNPENGDRSVKRNYLGVQPFALLCGRATVTYERLSKNGDIGIVLPFSLTFDPFGRIYNSRLDTTTGPSRLAGVNFIAGADVNFYFGKREDVKFFAGPRFRYGTDLFLRGIEAYSLQTQLGWRIKGDDVPVTQHISIGFGFARIISTPVGNIVDPKQSFGWMSVNYRLSFRW
jgi:hypothetical protein